MKLVINGVLIEKEDYTGGNSASIDISEEAQTGLRKKAVSQEFVLRGEAYTIVETELISDPNGKNKSIPVVIFEDSCCDQDILIFTGIIRGDSVNWCYGDCECEVNFFEKSDDATAMDCIKSTLIYDNWNGFQEQNHPRIVYCVEIRPDFVQYCVMIFGIIHNIGYFSMLPIVLFLTAVEEFLQFLVNTINSLFGTNISFNIGFDQDNSTNLLQEYLNMNTILNEMIIGCGRKHPSPLVRDYISNVCDKCNLTWESSIYNNPESDYYMAVYLSAPVEKGTKDNNVKWIDENHPILTLDLLLDQLKIVHNGDYKIIGSVLYFERYDFFNDGQIWVSFEELFNAGKVEGKLCLSWRDDEKPAYISMQYGYDAADIVGNEANQRFSDIVEWNLPFSELQSGQRRVVLPFGTPRFRDDGIDTDILGEFAWFNLGGIIDYGEVINNHQSVLTLEKGTCFNPKLLIWDGNLNFGRTVKYNIAGFDIPASENYNFPYMFNEHNSVPNTAYPTDHPDSGLYPRFYALDNPKLINDQGLDFEFKFRYDCETLVGALTAKYVLLPQGTGRIRKLTLNLDEKTVQVIGEV